MKQNAKKKKYKKIENRKMYLQESITMIRSTKTPAAIIHASVQEGRKDYTLPAKTKRAKKVYLFIPNLLY